MYVSCMSHAVLMYVCYRYWQRDEIVNVQGIIEDTHEKLIQQEKEYMQERKLYTIR